MCYLLLFVLLFQLSVVSDLPTFDTHKKTLQKIDEMAANSEICVTLQIDKISDFSMHQESLQKGTAAQIPTQKFFQNFNFEQLLYYNKSISFYVILQTSVIFLLLTQIKESIILDIEPLPS